MGGNRRTLGLLALAFLLGIAYVAWLASGSSDGAPARTPGIAEQATSTPRPSRTPRPTRTPRPSATPQVSPSPSPTPRPFRVGVVAGHWKSDSGAVCPDGLQEVTINLDVASRVVAILQYEGYQAELLPEFTDRLEGYQADVFVSIHADSCNIPEASGFKVARVAASVIPDREDRLVACLIDEYGQATGLALHEHSITYDMTLYHAFSEIDPNTPGAIIELGFMAADRDLLTDHAYEVAQGVARGIACFLEGE
ncbi:MAG: N-acetylmuramoyl-L-alanine amidase [Anaerolineae bacterium]